MGWKWSFPVC